MLEFRLNLRRSIRDDEELDLAVHSLPNRLVECGLHQVSWAVGKQHQAHHRPIHVHGRRRGWGRLDLRLGGNVEDVEIGWTTWPELDPIPIRIAEQRRVVRPELPVRVGLTVLLVPCFAMLTGESPEMLNAERGADEGAAGDRGRDRREMKCPLREGLARCVGEEPIDPDRLRQVMHEVLEHRVAAEPVSDTRQGVGL